MSRRKFVSTTRWHGNGIPDNPDNEYSVIFSLHRLCRDALVTSQLVAGSAVTPLAQTILSEMACAYGTEFLNDGRCSSRSDTVARFG